MYDNCMIKKDCVILANSLIFRLELPIKKVRHSRQIGAKFFTMLYEAITGNCLNGIFNFPVTDTEEAYNIQKVIDCLQGRLGLCLPHITGPDIATGCPESTYNLLEIMNDFLECCSGGRATKLIDFECWSPERCCKRNCSCNACCPSPCKTPAIQCAQPSCPIPCCSPGCRCSICCMRKTDCCQQPCDWNDDCESACSTDTDELICQACMSPTFSPCPPARCPPCRSPCCPSTKPCKCSCKSCCSDRNFQCNPCTMMDCMPLPLKSPYPNYTKCKFQTTPFIPVCKKIPKEPTFMHGRSMPKYLRKYIRKKQKQKICMIQEMLDLVDQATCDNKCKARCSTEFIPNCKSNMICSPPKCEDDCTRVNYLMSKLQSLGLYPEGRGPLCGDRRGPKYAKAANFYGDSNFNDVCGTNRSLARSRSVHNRLACNLADLSKPVCRPAHCF